MINLSDPRLMGDLFGLSELALLLARRSAGSARSADRGSLLLLWGVLVASLVAAIYCALTVRAADSALLRQLVPLGLVLYIGGLMLRWYSILYLGKYFTVNVAIAADHRVVDTGPYRYIRHPSYTGALLALVGLGICYRNWLGLLLLVVPVSLAFLYRIRVEEAALRNALGEAYVLYSTHTRRLVPFVY